MADSLCEPFPVVPAAPTCLGNCAELSLCKVPRKYPRTTAISTLQDAYTFTSKSDFDVALTLIPLVYNISSTNINPTDDPCVAEGNGNLRTFYSYIDVILNQESKENRDTGWILDYTTRLCTLGTTGITKGPSHISLFNAIQEIMAPPTVAPGVIPGVAQIGTRIPKPKGECEDGTWVLNYVDGKLKWRCDKGSSTPTDVCENLTIRKVRVLTASGGTEVTGTITTDIIQNNPNPVIEVSWEYTNWDMPGVGVSIRLAAIPTDPGKKPIASVGWINSIYPDTMVSLGPAYIDKPPAEEDDGEVSALITDVSEFPFSWSAITCYSKNQESGDYSDTEIRVDASVPTCPSLETVTNSFMTTCAPADGVLSISRLVITDELGVEYPDNKIGSLCDDVRSGVFYVQVTYENLTDSMYIADSEMVGIQVSSDSDILFTYDPGKAPSMLDSGVSVSYSYKVSYRLGDSICHGNLKIQTPSVLEQSTDVLINAECEGCPGFQITNLYLLDTVSGKPITDVWDIGCAYTASRRVTVVATLAPEFDNMGYRNRNGDTLHFSAAPGEGVDLFIPGGEDITVPDIARGSTSQVSVDYTVNTTKELPIVKDNTGVSGSVEFIVTADTADEGAVSAKADLSILRICGVLELVPGSVRLYRAMGGQFDLVSAPINDCSPGGYEFVLGYELRNVASNAYFSDTLTVDSTIECKAGDLLTGPSSHSSTKEISNLGPGEIVVGYTPRFTVQTTEDNFSGQVQLSFSIDDYSISGSKTVGINEDCPSFSSSSSSDPCDGDSDCCPYVESGDEEWVDISMNKDTGRCVIDLTAKAKNNGAALPELIGDGCIYVSPVVDGKITIKSELSVDDSTIKMDENCKLSAVFPTLTQGKYMRVTKVGTGYLIASTLTPGDGIDISDTGRISATGGTADVCGSLIEGDGISIVKNDDGKCVISATKQDTPGNDVDVCSALIPGNTMVDIGPSTDDSGKCKITPMLTRDMVKVAVNGGLSATYSNDGTTVTLSRDNVNESICDKLVEGSGINITKNTNGTCTIAATAPQIDVCSKLKQGTGIKITTDTAGNCVINATGSTSGGLGEGTGISISGGLVSVDIGWLTGRINDAINAWMSNKNNTTTCS